jgi:hypothetical protein
VDYLYGASEVCWCEQARAQYWSNVGLGKCSKHRNSGGMKKGFTPGSVSAEGYSTRKVREGCRREEYSTASAGHSSAGISSATYTTYTVRTQGSLCSRIEAYCDSEDQLTNASEQ